MSNNKEIWMETTHGRKSKCKTEFKAVVNKVLVSTLILTTVLGTTTPAFAATLPQDDSVSKNQITQQYGISVEQSIQELKNTINTINAMKLKGTVSEATLKTLAHQLYSLETAVRASDAGVTAEVKDIIINAESAIKYLDNAGDAKIAIAVVKANLGIDSVTIVNKQATVKPKGFHDVATNNWAYKNIMLCVEHGAIAGTKAPDANGMGYFSPNTNVTAGQFITVLARLLAEDYIDADAYPTSEGYHWAYANYVAAIESGIITGKDFKSDAASLNKDLSREDMAYLLVRAASVNGENLEILPRVETMMKDYNTISADRKEAVKQAYSNGLIAGFGDGTFGPNATMTRAQMATVVCRLMKYAPRGTVTVPDDSKPEVIVSQDKSQYVATSGDYKGYLKAGFSRQKELEALSMIKLGEDSKGVYMTVTAPSMPDVIKNEFTYTFVCTVYNSKGDYFADQARVEGLKAGETKTAYLVSFQDTGVKSSEISEIRLSVMINNATGYEHMFTRSISNTDKSTAYAKFDIGQADNVKFDSTSIWKGIGK